MKSRFIAFCGVLLILSSCAGLTQVTVPQSNINICGENIITGPKETYTLQKTYILGIGGMSEKARNTNVVDELFKKVNLQKNETLAYITQSKNFFTFLGIVTTVKHSASGYVVKVVGEDYQISTECATDDVQIPKTPRQTILIRLKELNNLLEGDCSEENIALIKEELEEIEAWYGENKINTNEERKELKKAQYLLDNIVSNNTKAQ